MDMLDGKLIGSPDRLYLGEYSDRVYYNHILLTDFNISDVLLERIQNPFAICFPIELVSEVLQRSALRRELLLQPLNSQVLQHFFCLYTSRAVFPSQTIGESGLAGADSPRDQDN